MGDIISRGIKSKLLEPCSLDRIWLKKFWKNFMKSFRNVYADRGFFVINLE